jgi:hypothetical protein
MMDFNRFFEQVVSAAQMARLTAVLRIATDEMFCEKVFGAYSATARLKLVAAAIRHPTEPLWEVDTEGMH